MGLNNNYEKLDDENVRTPDNISGYSSVPLDNKEAIQQQQQQQFINPLHSIYPPQYLPSHIQQQQQQQQQEQQQPYYVPPHLQQQLSQPVYIQEYPPIPQVIVKTTQTEGESDFTPALVILLAGFCVCFIWFFNIRYLKSKNKNARTLAICSVVFGAIYLVFFLFVFIPLMVRVSNESYYYSRD